MDEVPKKDKKCHWSDSDQKNLLVICREYHKRNGIDTHFNWTEITEKFIKNSGKVVKPKDCKNKFDYMKSLWRAYMDLRHKETGCGWNESTHTVEASDEWWDKKIKENDKYRRFRRKPVDMELAELWDSVYNSICATGQHCVSANMDHTPSTPFDASVGDNDDIDAYLLYDEDVDLQGFTQPFVPPVTQETSSALGKRPIAPGSSSQMPKGNKKRSSMTSAYTAYMASMDDKSDRLLCALQGDLASTGNTGHGKFYAIEDSYAVINRLVAEGVIERISPLWCYAMDELNNEQSRHLFMTLQTDQEKMAWLQYKFNKCTK